ncbi:hypothetical protein GCM10023223_03570 [Stackebrandtia albiflava]
MGRSAALSSLAVLCTLGVASAAAATPAETPTGTQTCQVAPHSGALFDAAQAVVDIGAHLSCGGLTVDLDAYAAATDCGPAVSGSTTDPATGAFVHTSTIRCQVTGAGLIRMGSDVTAVNGHGGTVNSSRSTTTTGMAGQTLIVTAAVTVQPFYDRAGRPPSVRTSVGAAQPGRPEVTLTTGGSDTVADRRTDPPLRVPTVPGRAMPQQAI